ncbi:hypothetical protein EMPG_09653, partial [Blastomyces silverae]
ISDYYYRVFYKYSYNTSNHFLLADETEILLSIITLFFTNLSHLIFKFIVNSVSISQSITQSLIFSSIISLFTINLLISVLLQIIADSFILKISIYNHSLSHHIISNQIYKNLLRFLISD